MTLDREQQTRMRQKQHIVTYILLVIMGLIFLHLALVFNLYDVIKNVV
jgi:hypothetical protein